MATPFTIYSTGDGAFLTEVLNAVAMLMNNGGFVGVAAIGILLGFVFAIASSVLKAGQSLPLTGPLLAIVIYMVMFIPKVDVIVYDTYSMAGRSVDNVPLGVAFAGTTLSHIGLYVTETFEQAYTIPGMTSSGGYATPLEMLLMTRKYGIGQANSIADDDNFTQTIANYLNDCTNTGIMMGYKNPAHMLEEHDVWKALKWDSPAFTTETHLPGDGSGKLLTCTDAYNAIDAKWGDYLNAWNADLSKNTPGTDYRSAVQDALGTFTGLGVSADDYMKASFLSNMINTIVSGNYNAGTLGATMIMTQATEQVRVQFAAEASLFARFARPMMTFVEGFVYGIVPFMVFALGFGLGGIKLIGRYFMILMWVQLWMPLMSLTNLFVDMSFMRRMDALNTGGSGSGGGGGTSASNAFSLLGLDKLQGDASDWVAVAGNLVAATPALALTVLYGGAYTMVNLAGRLHPIDSIDETQAAPAMLNNQGLTSVQPRVSNTAMEGTMKAGSAEQTGSVSLGDMISNVASSARQEQTQAQQAFSKSVTQSISSGVKAGMSLNEMEKLGQNLDISQSNAYSHAIKDADAFSRQYGLSTQTANQVRGAVTASAGAGADTPVIKLGANIKSEMASSHSADEVQKAMTDLRRLGEEASSHETQQAFKQTVSKDATNTSTESWESYAQTNNSRDYNETLSHLQSVSQTYQTAQSATDTGGFEQKMNLATVAKHISDSPAAYAQAQSWMARHSGDGGQAAVLERADKLGEFYRGENAEQRAVAAAVAEHLSQNLDGNEDNQATLMGMLTESNLVAAGTGPSEVDSGRNQGVSGNAGAAAGGAMQEIPGHVANADQMTQGVAANTAAHAKSLGERYEDASQKYYDQKDDFDKHAASNQANTGEELRKSKNFVASSIQNGSTPNSAAVLSGKKDYMAAKLSGGTEDLKQSLHKEATQKYGYTDAQADYFVQKYMGEHQSTSQFSFGKSAGTDSALSRGKEDTKLDQARDAVYQEQLQKAGGNAKAAKEQTELITNRFDQVASAGRAGLQYTPGVRSFNAVENNRAND